LRFSLADTKHALGTVENLTLPAAQESTPPGNLRDNMLNRHSGANVLKVG